MSSRLFPLYNIDQPVGPGKPNMPDDVRLVQALLIELSRFDGSLWVQDVPAQTRSLATSGSFSDTLGQWILALQRWAVKNFGGGSNFKADGIIHPMPMASTIDVSTHFKSGRISILSFVCNRLWKYNRDAYLRIGDDYRVPWIPAGWDN
jgi:hypothetical protein